MRPRVALVIGVLVYSCGPRLPQPPYAPQPTSALVEAPYPPPPARAEIVPAQPTRRAVWIDGEWVLRGRKWAWQPGRWVIPPKGAKYSAWTTVRGEDGALYVAPGAWRNEAGKEIPAPTPLALGESAQGAVIGPNGEVETVAPNLTPEDLTDGGASEIGGGGP